MTINRKTVHDSEIKSSVKKKRERATHPNKLLMLFSFFVAFHGHNDEMGEDGRERGLQISENIQHIAHVI